MEQKNISKELFVIPVFDTVIMPSMSTKIRLNNETGKKINNLMNLGKSFAIALTVKTENKITHLTEENLYKIGCLIHIDSIQKSDNFYVAYIKSLKRIKIEEFIISEDEVRAKYIFFPSESDLDEKSRQSLMTYIIETIHEIGKNFQGAKQFIKDITKIKTPEEIIGLIIPFLPVSILEKQELLEIDSERHKGMRFIDILLQQKNSLELQLEMARKFNEKLNKSHRETILREQLKAIQEELGETKKNSKNRKDFRQRIEDAMMPADVKDVALEQLEKLETYSKDSHESAVIQNYLDLLINLPWQSETAEPIDIKKAKKILNQDHYGIEKVKTRIIQHLAVMKLKNNKKGSIILLVGPPGTGKTSLGKSIARAMDRKYIRLSLGGIRDEAEIRGHRRTYIGALPGRIIQGIKKIGSKNPVFVLDEVDKLMVGYSGDPASALLEVLDPEQNNTFTDHYLEIPYDLSEVFFICTANSLTSIPEPLMDRMEVIEMTGYTHKEKLKIAMDHLIKDVIEEHGLDLDKISFEESALTGIITLYTREAGVRGLKRELSKIARIVSEKIVSESVSLPIIIKEDMLKELLGKAIIRLDSIPKNSVPGVTTGLAWTPAGGDILFIECSLMAGKGDLLLTGQLGDVMKESARISMSLIQSRLIHLLGYFDFSKYDIHIHIPSGAIPKDGPSAGITLFTALASLLLHKSIDSKLAMTGEITLRGSVLPVGGIKEKILAAHRVGIRHIIISRENEEDLNEIPDDVKNALKFSFVETIEDVVNIALQITLPNPIYYKKENNVHEVTS